MLVLYYVLVASKMEVSCSLLRERKRVYMKEYDIGYTSSTSSKRGKVSVQAWCQRMTKGGSETCAQLWEQHGFVQKRREHSLQIKVQRLSKGLEVGQVGLCEGVLVYAEELCFRVCRTTFWMALKFKKFGFLWPCSRWSRLLTVSRDDLSACLKKTG